MTNGNEFMTEKNMKKWASGKIATLGAVLVGCATIGAFAIEGVNFFHSTPASAQTPTSAVTINNASDKTAIVTDNHGNIALDQRSGTFVELPPQGKQLTIEAPVGTVVSLASMPSLNAQFEKDGIVCQVRSGSAVRALRTAADPQVGPAGWSQVEVLDGDCKGKVGWVVSGNTQYK